MFMISSETRNRKPYALPVQCLPIASLKDAAVRDLDSGSYETERNERCRYNNYIIQYINVIQALD